METRVIENPRVAEELELLQKHFDDVECRGADGSYWFRVEPLHAPANCEPEQIAVVFSVTTGHPGPPPYGFYIPSNLTRDGAPIETKPPPAAPPFGGDWRFVSHQPEQWCPAANVTEGDNLWGWVRSIRERIGVGG